MNRRPERETEVFVREKWNKGKLSEASDGLPFAFIHPVAKGAAQAVHPALKNPGSQSAFTTCASNRRQCSKRDVHLQH
jgi:hypothetical protein